MGFAIRRPLPVAGALIAMGMLVAAPGCTADEPGVDGAPARVRAVVLPFLTQTPFQIAADEGFFEEQGLDVEFVRLPRIQDLNTALTRGEVDVAAGMLTVTLMNSVAAGGRLGLVATIGHLAPDHCPFHAWLTRRQLAESGDLDDAATLRGITVDVDPILPDAYFMSRTLAPLGLDLDDVEITNVPPTAAPESLLQGNIDITGLPQPMLDLATTDEEIVIWRRTEEILPGYPISLLMYGPTLLDQRRDTGRRFLVALLRALDQFRQGKTPRNRAIVERFVGLSAEQAAAVCWPAPPDDPRVDFAPLLEYQRWALERGLAERVLSEEELVDHGFLREIRAGPGTDRPR